MAERKTKILAVAVNVCRLLLAATFLLSGFAKANDPLGTVYKLQDYCNSMLHISLPETFLTASSVILSTMEFTLGACILFAMKKKSTARFTLLLMAAMTAFTVYIAIADPVPDCGCFGDVIILSNTATLAKNIVLLAAAIVIYKHYRLQMDIVGPSIKWLIILLSFCSTIAYSAFCIINLPYFDFRPYKIGTDMYEGVTRAEQEFDIKIVYEKEGQMLELSAEDDDPDSTWQYVETRRIPVGEKKEVLDFHVTSAEGDDITEDILLQEGYQFMLIIPDLLKADEGCINHINEIYDYSVSHNIPFYCLTASFSPEAQKYWTEHTGAEYGYLMADDRMLKTVVRAKPGLVLLNSAVITHKWSNYNMPDTLQLNNMLQPTEQ